MRPARRRGRVVAAGISTAVAHNAPHTTAEAVMQTSDDAAAYTAMARDARP